MTHHRRRAGTRRGFSMLELLVVVIVIAVLAAGLMPKTMVSSGQMARGAGVREDAVALGSYFDAYATLRGQLLPTDQTALSSAKAGYATASATSTWAIRTVSADRKGALLVVADASDSTRRCTLGIGSSARATPMTCTFWHLTERPASRTAVAGTHSRSQGPHPDESVHRRDASRRGKACASVPEHLACGRKKLHYINAVTCYQKKS